MDPNEALRLLRADLETYHGGAEDHLALAASFAEHFAALDEWLTRGGTPPEAWREGPDAFGTEEGK